MGQSRADQTNRADLAVDAFDVRRPVQRPWGRPFHIALEVGYVAPVEAHENGPEPQVTVEVRGLSLHTHHGITAAEQEVGQRLVIDVVLEVPACDAVLTDRVEDTVDYAEVAEVVTLVATECSYRTLERLCRVIGERLLDRFDADSARVRAAKPEPPIPLSLEEVAVEVFCEHPLDDQGSD